MEKLQVKLHFKSGKTMVITSQDYYEGQFREWARVNIVQNEFKRYDFALWTDSLINLGTIEKMEEIKGGC